MNRPRSYEDWEQFPDFEEEVEPVDFQLRYEEFKERTVMNHKEYLDECMEILEDAVSDYYKFSSYEKNDSSYGEKETYRVVANAIRLVNDGEK